MSLMDGQDSALRLHAGYLPGCIGRVVQMHAEYYSAQAGFGAVFEAQVAAGLAQFLADFDPLRDGLWLVVRGNEVLGSIAIEGSRAQREGAQLRWFIVGDDLRGRGAGALLLDTALAFCRERQTGRVYLWTFDQLHTARHLYEKRGFALELNRVGRQWGSEVNEQLFAMNIP